MDQPPSNPIAYFSGGAAGASTGGAGSHPDPLTPEQLSQITHARARYRKVNRAIRVATGDAWTTAIFAGISLLGSVFFFSIPGILVGLGMAVISYNSFRGLRAIRSLDASGARLLAKNQLLFGTILFLYAAWNIYLLWSGHANSGNDDPIASELSDAGYDAAGLERYIGFAVYFGVAAFALIGQSLTALYYFSRQKYIQEYLSRTAEWVLQMQKMGFKL
jgi:hypothetical protein